MRELNLDERVLRQRVLVMQVIAAALLASVLAFLGVVLYLVQQDGPLNPMPDGPVVTYVGYLLFVTVFAAWLFVPNLIGRSAVAQIAAGTWALPQGSRGAPAAAVDSDEEKLLFVYQTKMIVAAALLEGVAFFCCLAYLLEGQTSVLGLLGVLVFFMLASFPTRGKVRSWVDLQARRVDELRQGRA